MGMNTKIGSNKTLRHPEHYLRPCLDEFSIPFLCTYSGNFHQPVNLLPGLQFFFNYIKAGKSRAGGKKFLTCISVKANERTILNGNCIVSNG